MSTLTSRAQSQVESLARQTGFSIDAVESMLHAVNRGNGRMAQFDHPEFKGAGQWMQGGMLMVSEPSDRALERRIDRLCEALAEWVAEEPAATARDETFQRQSQSSNGRTRVQDSRDLDPFAAIERLADLHAKGILGDDEFAAKKAELLARI